MTTSTTQPPRTALILHNLPHHSFAGIDLLSFTTAPQFHGIRHVPPGLHFCFVSPTNSFSLRHGAWFRVHTPSHPDPAPTIVVKQWKAETEELVSADQTETLRWRANLGGVWREGLSPYRQSANKASPPEDEADKTATFDDIGDWPLLTDAMTDHLLDRILGPGVDANHWGLTSASSAKQDEDYIPGLTEKATEALKETELRFLPIDLRRTWREGAVGRERTDAARDRSWALRDIVESHCRSWDDVVGELQFCFIMVLTLNNNSCFEQWKRILGLVFTCVSAVASQSEFFIKIIKTLRLQLEHCQDAEGGLFDLQDEAGNILKVLLRRFRKSLEQISGMEKQDVLSELDELEEYLQDQFGWSLNDQLLRSGVLELEDGEQVHMDMAQHGDDADEDEDGEFAPVIVDLTAEQMAALGQNGENMPITLQQKRHIMRAEDAEVRKLENGEEDSEEDDRGLDELDPQI